MEKLTTVKIEEGLFDKFKTESIKYKISFKSLVARSIYLYSTDKSFRDKINSQLSTRID